MTAGFHAILGSMLEVYGLVACAWLYARRFRPDLTDMLRLGMHVFVPALTFVAILDAHLELRDLSAVTAATLIQIGSGLFLGWIALRLAGWKSERELLLPICFVNSAYLAYPVMLANYGQEGLSRGVLSNTVTTVVMFTVGVLLLHGRSRIGRALREPVFWAVCAAGLLRILRIHPPDLVLRVPRLAAGAAVPVMLVIFGAALARTRLTSLPKAVLGTVMRYASGAAGLVLALRLLHPTGILRSVLIVYALLPSAVINVPMTEEAGRDAETVASIVLLASLVSVILLPIVMAMIR